jgi:hypothetical protein
MCYDHSQEDMLEKIKNSNLLTLQDFPRAEALHF